MTMTPFASQNSEQIVVKQALRAASVGLDVLTESEVRSGAPHFDRRGVVDRLRGAMGDLFVAKDALEVSDDATLEAALTASAARLREAWSLLAVAQMNALSTRLTPIFEASQALQFAADRLVARVIDRGTRGSRAPVPPVLKEQVASDDLPRVQHLSRRVVLPALAVADDEGSPVKEAPGPPPPRRAPTTIEELAARKAAGIANAVASPSAVVPPPPRSVAPRVAFAPEEQRRRLARSAFDDVTSLCLLRRPNDGESWLAQSAFERRLLAHLDALLSLGDAGLGETVLALAEVRVPDEARATAAALVLGSVAGSDTAAQLLRFARGMKGEALSGFGLGMFLAPSTDLDAALSETMAEAPAEEAAFAIKVLSRRGAFPVALVPTLLARREDLLDAAISFALGRAVSRPRAHEWLVDLADPHRADTVFLPALDALARRAHPTAGALLADMLALGPESPRAQLAAQLLGPTGRLAHAEQLAEFVLARPDVAAIRSLGHLGAPGVVPTLQKLLVADDSAHRVAAAEALDRLAGPVLRSSVEVPFSPHAPPGAPGRMVARPSLDAAAWDAYFRGAAGRAQLASATRLRWGRPLTAALCVAEIGHPEASPADRLACALCLASFRGDLVRFDPDDWVARQRAVIVSLSDLDSA